MHTDFFMYFIQNSVFFIIIIFSQAQSVDNIPILRMTYLWLHRPFFSFRKLVCVSLICISEEIQKGNRGEFNALVLYREKSSMKKTRLLI